MTDEHTPKHSAPDVDLAKRTARRKRIRTAFQTFVSSCGVLLVVVPLAMEYLDGKVEPTFYAALAGVAVAITTGARLVTRVMQTPAITTFIDQHIPWLAEEDPAG